MKRTLKISAILTALILFFAGDIAPRTELVVDRDGAVLQNSHPGSFILTHKPPSPIATERFSSSHSGGGKIYQLYKTVVTGHTARELVIGAAVEAHLLISGLIVPALNIRTALYPFHFFW